jgi:hypothetical protein
MNASVVAQERYGTPVTLRRVRQSQQFPQSSTQKQCFYIGNQLRKQKHANLLSDRSDVCGEVSSGDLRVQQTHMFRPAVAT